jgi:DNA-directed RNA polymerase specialized sigma24 family protein
LLHRVAGADRSALAELYRIVSADVRVQVEHTLPDPGDVDAVMAATFVEVWWLARGHAGSHLDVRVWIRAIASRRAGDRHRNNAAGGSPDHVSGSCTRRDATVSQVQDETTAMMCAGLINGWLVDRAGNWLHIGRRPVRVWASWLGIGFREPHATMAAR